MSSELIIFIIETLSIILCSFFAGVGTVWSLALSKEVDNPLAQNIVPWIKLASIGFIALGLFFATIYGLLYLQG